jgi:hypothetical protein
MSQDRRAAIAAYKERKSVAGVYALRCEATGEVWVGETLDIDKAFNRLVFSLNSGRWPRPALQAAWTAHGASAFAFEALERMEEAPSAYARDADLKARRDLWRLKLAALAV